jgi:hypothetical protein
VGLAVLEKVHGFVTELWRKVLDLYVMLCELIEVYAKAVSTYSANTAARSQRLYGLKVLIL